MLRNKSSRLLMKNDRYSLVWNIWNWEIPKISNYHNGWSPRGLVKQPLLVNWLISWLKNKKPVQWWLLRISIVQQPLTSWRLWDNKSMSCFDISTETPAVEIVRNGLEQARANKNDYVPDWRLVVCRLMTLCASCMILRILLIQMKFFGCR